MSIPVVCTCTINKKSDDKQEAKEWSKRVVEKTQALLMNKNSAYAV